MCFVRARLPRTPDAPLWPYEPSQSHLCKKAELLAITSSNTGLRNLFFLFLDTYSNKLPLFHCCASLERAYREEIGLCCSSRSCCVDPSSRDGLRCSLSTANLAVNQPRRDSFN